MKKGTIEITAVYCLAGAAAVLVGSRMGSAHPYLLVGMADLTGTLVVFCFSLICSSSSVYDPYWSVSPIVIAVYWAFPGSPDPGNWIRRMMVLALVFIWGIRLTLNWAYRWGGLSHEDWRYRDIRARFGGAYWLISLLGIHLMPTLLVFLGCLALLPALSSPTALNGLDLLAALITAAAIGIETLADLEINRLGSDSNQDALHQSGLWSFSRHPNYFGEIMFWWGLYLFALAADPAYWWAIIGPISITLLFLTVSIPMIEKRLKERKPAYSHYIKTTSVLIPWKRKREKAD
jgi:steroid 5-alpha reductase family enzyme